MIRAEIYPTEEQKLEINRLFGSRRHAFNLAVHYVSEFYNSGRNKNLSKVVAITNYKYKLFSEIFIPASPGGITYERYCNLLMDEIEDYQGFEPPFLQEYNQIYDEKMQGCLSCTYHDLVFSDASTPDNVRNRDNVISQKCFRCPNNDDLHKINISSWKSNLSFPHLEIFLPSYIEGIYQAANHVRDCKKSGRYALLKPLLKLKNDAVQSCNITICHGALFDRYEINAIPISRCISEDQKSFVLPFILSGEIRAAHFSSDSLSFSDLGKVTITYDNGRYFMTLKTVEYLQARASGGKKATASNAGYSNASLDEWTGGNKAAASNAGYSNASLDEWTGELSLKDLMAQYANSANRKSVLHNQSDHIPMEYFETMYPEGELF